MRIWTYSLVVSFNIWTRGNLRRKSDSIFGSGKKKKTHFQMVQFCCGTHAVPHSHWYSGSPSTDEEQPRHLLPMMPWLMSADIPPHISRNGAYLRVGKTFDCTSFYTTSKVFAFWNFILQRIQWIILHRNDAFVTQTPLGTELLTLQPIFMLRNAFDCVGYLSAGIPDVLDPHVSTVERCYPYPP